MQTRITELEDALSDCFGAFVTTLMVCFEKNGDTEPDVRYKKAMAHPVIRKAKRVLYGSNIPAQTPEGPKAP